MPKSIEEQAVLVPDREDSMTKLEKQMQLDGLRSIVESYQR